MEKIYEICLLGENNEAVQAVFSDIEKNYRIVRREIFGETNLVYPIKKRSKATLASIWVEDRNLTDARKTLANAQIFRYLILKTNGKELDQESLSSKIELQKKRDEIRVAQKKEARKPVTQIKKELPAETKPTKEPKKITSTAGEKTIKEMPITKAKPTKQKSETTDKKRLDDLDKKLAEILSDDAKI